ncbi:hypothetical protein [Flavobacterium sp.]
MKNLSLFLNVNAQECGFETPEKYHTYDDLMMKEFQIHQPISL